MTKKSIKLNLNDALKIVDMDYHDFLLYCNDNVFPMARMDTDFYTVFKTQRHVIHGILWSIIREL